MYIVTTSTTISTDERRHAIGEQPEPNSTYWLNFAKGQLDVAYDNLMQALYSIDFANDISTSLVNNHPVAAMLRNAAAQLAPASP